VKVKPGTRLRSVVCETEVIVVRAPVGDVSLRCGGQAMVLIERSSLGVHRRSATSEIEPGLAGGTLLGKRYVAEGSGLEVLCTKSGLGTLSLNESPLMVKASKPLPSSD